MQISKDPPHDIPKGSYMYNWETKARRFFKYFEMHKKGAHEWMQRVRVNPFTSTQEFLRFYSRMMTPDILELRQQLGDITGAEVSSVNRVVTKHTPYIFRKARGEPAKMVAYRKNILWVAAASTFGVAYTMIYHRKGLLWWVAPFVPLVFYVLYNRSRQPVNDIANGYRLILAKRTATAQLAEQDKEFAMLRKSNPKLNDLADYLKTEKKTMYEMEKEMLDDIMKNKF